MHLYFREQGAINSTLNKKRKIRKKISMKNKGKKISPKRETMRLNYFLANKYVLIGLTICITLILFAAFNYVINSFYLLADWTHDMEHPEKYLGLKNCLLNLDGASRFKYLLIAISVLVIIVVDFAFIYRVRTYLGEESFNVGQKGTTRWTTIEEIKKQYKEIDEKDTKYSGYPGFPVSRYENKMYIDNSMTNNLILGLTRSGKDEIFTIPCIDIYSRAEVQPSMVIIDPKLEQYKSSKSKLEERGYTTLLLNLIDPLHSMGFNPLTEVVEAYKKKDYADAELLAQSFAYSVFNPDESKGDSQFFDSSSVALLTALILAHVDDCLKEDERNGTTIHEKEISLYSIINTFTELGRQQIPNTPLTMLDVYFQERPMLDRAKLKYGTIELAGSRTKGSVFANMMTKLSIFTYENIAKMTAESSLNLVDIGFGEKPLAIFLGIPDYDRSTHFIASVFIRQVYFVLAKNCQFQGKCKRPVKFILNEFGNMPRVEAMESIITVCLGRNISFDLYVQSYTQIDDLYGDSAKTIKQNCGNHIYLMTNDIDTAESFSKLIGSETITDIQRTGEKLSLSKTIMESTLERPLLNANELMELKEGHCVVKRVMKRQDQERNRIVPYPIFNCDEFGTTMKYRYEYLSDSFPLPDTINLTEINTEDRSHINHTERVWNYDLTFQEFDRQKLEAVRVENHKKENARSETADCQDICLCQLKVEVLEGVWRKLEELLGEDFEVQYNLHTDTTTVQEFYNIIDQAGIEDIWKKALKTQLRNGVIS